MEIHVQSQPDDTTCGPTCLQAIYRFHGLELPLEEILASVPTMPDGGTLSVLLAIDALRRGFETELRTADLDLFDPTWFGLEAEELIRRLRARVPHAKDPRAEAAVDAYVDFIRLGGQLAFAEFTGDEIRRPLKRRLPVLAGLSATYLYRSAREIGDPMEFDDIEGQPQGHFVVLTGWDRKSRRVEIADPFRENPLSDGPKYHVKIERLVAAMALGALTYDANVLILRKRA